MIQNLFFFFFFFFFRGVGSLSQPRLNIFTVGNMRIMICLGQGGLRSLSASSFKCDQHYALLAVPRIVHNFHECTILVYLSVLVMKNGKSE